MNTSLDALNILQSKIPLSRRLLIRVEEYSYSKTYHITGVMEHETFQESFTFFNLGNLAREHMAFVERIQRYLYLKHLITSYRGRDWSYSLYE